VIDSSSVIDETGGRHTEYRRDYRNQPLVTELQQNRYDALLRRVGDLKGPGSKVNDVLQELFPTIDVENVPGELLFLMGTKIGWAATSKTPTAGKRTGIQLFNPANSGHIVTISSLHVSMNLSGIFTYGLVITTLSTNSGIPRLRDGRAGVGPSGVSELRTSVDAAGLLSGTIRVLTGATFTLQDPNGIIVLTPGSGMTVVGTVDANLAVSFNYRERVAEPSELSF